MCTGAELQKIMKGWVANIFGVKKLHGFDKPSSTSEGGVGPRPPQIFTVPMPQPYITATH